MHTRCRDCCVIVLAHVSKVGGRSGSRLAHEACSQPENALNRGLIAVVSYINWYYRKHCYSR
jgi:hypothetical protein